MRITFLFIMLCLCAPRMKAQPITAGEQTRVETIYGPIEGYLDGSIYTFKGIPYAKAERFMPPQKPDHFTKLRQCKVYGPQAPQGESLRWNDRNSQTDYGFGNQFVVEPMDEKGCLVLNVWTPGLGNKKQRPSSYGFMVEDMPAVQATTYPVTKDEDWPKRATSLSLTSITD